MSDISKCEGAGCTAKEGCWRFVAPSSTWQSYLLPTNPGDKCEMYWPTENQEILDRIDSAVADYDNLPKIGKK